MSLSNIAIDVLATLTNDTLDGLSSSVDEAVTSLAAVKTEKRGIINNINISLSSLESKYASTVMDIDTLTEQVSVVSINMARQAPELGLVNASLKRSLFSKDELSADIAFEIGRLKSVKVAITAEIAQLDITNQYFSDLKTAINSAKASR